MTSAFWHVGLTVSDLARSIIFYRDIAGMEAGTPLRGADTQFAQLVNNPGATVETVFMTQGVFTLQLLQYLTKGGKKLGVGHQQIGSPHLSFFVADVQAHYAALQARPDVSITSHVVTNRRATIKSFYVIDPDGVPVEFVEKLGQPRSAPLDRR